MGLEAIADGIKTRLETITTLKQIFASGELPDTINALPVALIIPGETSYHADMSEDVDYIFRILLLVSKIDAPSALSTIVGFIEITGDTSVKEAIEDDRTLNGSADDVTVTGNTGFGMIIWGGIPYLGTEFQLKVLA